MTPWWLPRSEISSSFFFDTFFKRAARVTAATYKSSAGAISHIPVSQVANIDERPSVVLLGRLRRRLQNGGHVHVAEGFGLGHDALVAAALGNFVVVLFGSGVM